MFESVYFAFSWNDIHSDNKKSDNEDIDIWDDNNNNNESS